MNLDTDNVLGALGNGADEDKDLLKLIRERFNQAVEFESVNRQERLDDIRFARLGDQWPEYAKYDRNRPGKERPMLVVNRLLQFRDRVVNEIRQNTPSIRIRPATSGADQDTAEVLMGMIHHIQDNSNAAMAYDTAVEWQVDTGLGYIRVRNDWSSDTSFDQEIYIDRIPDPFKVYYDPHSKSPDGSDAEWAIIAEEIPKDEFRRLYPDVDETSFDAAGNGDMQGWYTKDSVRICEYYYLQHDPAQIQDPETGQVRDTFIKRCMWVKAAGDRVLERSEIPTKWIPIVPVVGHEVWLQGKCYRSGLVRNAKDAQRLYNYYLSANAENVALSPKAPFVGVAGQFESDPNWGRANKESLAYLEYDPVSIAGTVAPPPQRAMPPMASNAIIEALRLAETDIMQSMGIYQPSLGDQSNETSGRALLLRQKQADTGNFHYQDNLNRSIRQIGRICVDMIPKIYDRARVVRILGEDGTSREINIDPSLPTASANTNDPSVDSIYNVGVGTYDVVCDSGPSYATKRDESANMMLMLTQANPALFQTIGDLMMKNMDWPGAEEISKRLQMLLPPELQPTAQGDRVDPQVIQAQRMMDQLAAQMEEMSQELQFLRDQRIMTIQDKERDWFDSQTKRMEVEAKIGETNERLQAMIQQNLAEMLNQTLPVLNEQNMEFEQMEENPVALPQQQASPGPATTPRRGPGSMTRKPDVDALTGESKPEEKI